MKNKVKQSPKDLLNKLGKLNYVQIFIIENNQILDSIYTVDVGQNVIVSKKLNKAFILPERKDGLIFGTKTMFFYSANNCVPLTLEDCNTIIEENKEFVYALTEKKGIAKTFALINKNPNDYMFFDENTTKCNVMKLKPCSIDTALLKSIIETRIVSDLIKTPTNMFEELKTPILVGICAVVFIAMLFTLT